MARASIQTVHGRYNPELTDALDQILAYNDAFSPLMAHVRIANFRFRTCLVTPSLAPDTTGWSMSWSSPPRMPSSALEFALDHSTLRLARGIWDVDSVDLTDQDLPPVYDPLSRTLSLSTSSNMCFFRRGNRPLNGGPPQGLLSPPSTVQSDPSRSFLQMEPHETFTYTYDLDVGSSRLQVLILVESDFDRPNHFTFSLSMKVGHVERAIAQPVVMRLSIDPRKLDFIVFAFSPRSSLPVGCLYNFRVWLRTAGVDHRMFGARDIWFGKDPDFRAIADASFAHLRNATQDMSIYQGRVGRAHVSFILRWIRVEPEIYALSLDYDAGGAGRPLFEDYHLRLSCEPQALSFLIYTIPVPSTPAGASHRLRVWIRTPAGAPSPIANGSLNSLVGPSYLYQRLWKSDDFKIGAQLDFASVGSKIILATRSRVSQDVDSSGLLGESTLSPNRRRTSRLAPSVGIDDAGDAVTDR